jgi:hypothetical protein
MTHSGKWCAVAALLGVSVLRVYGDHKQIPHIPRVEVPSKTYVRLQADVVEQTYITYRCAPALLAMWGDVYDWKVRTTNTETGVVKHITELTSMPGDRNVALLCMYQADKKTLKQMFPSAKGREDEGGGRLPVIMTTHESEGRTFDHVYLFRFDLRVRSDKFSLFDQEPYVLVASSRARYTFTYVCPQILNDQVFARLDQASNPRRLVAASDVNSSGVSKELA